MNWVETRLGDVLTLKRGYDLTEAQRQPGEIPVVSSSGITGSHNVAMVEGPGVVTGRYGTMGEVFYITGDFWPHNTALYVQNFKGNNPRFISYFLKYVLRGGASNKAAVPGVNRNELHERRVCVPDLETQRRITDHLISIDTLIENNRRRIDLLEQSARLLYREWFVHLRFPGHEHVRVVDGVPEGWKRKFIADVCASVDYGFTASAAEERVGPKFLRITDIVPTVIDWSSVPYCEIETGKLEKFRLAKGDIVVARTGATVGYAKILGGGHPESVFASYLVRFKPENELLASILGVYMESPEYKEYVWSRIGGAAQPNANAKVLGAAKLLVPPQEIAGEFHSTVSLLFEQREKLQALSEKLAEARDLMLPRLMTGELTV